MIKNSILALLFVFTAAASSYAQTAKDETSEQRRERLRIAVQAICPVSGESLTDHAKPVKMTNPETKEVLYVCCEACLEAKPDAKHIEKIRTNFAKAQGHCLVMTEALVTDGILRSPFSTRRTHAAQVMPLTPISTVCSAFIIIHLLV